MLCCYAGVTANPPLPGPSGPPDPAGPSDSPCDSRCWGSACGEVWTGAGWIADRIQLFQARQVEPKPGQHRQPPLPHIFTHMNCRTGVPSHVLFPPDTHLHCCVVLSHMRYLRALTSCSALAVAASSPFWMKYLPQIREGRKGGVTTVPARRGRDAGSAVTSL